MVRVDRITLVICLVSLIESLSYSIVLPLIPYVSQKFGANELVIGLIFAVYSVCQLLTAPLIGLWSDRFGRKPLLLISQFTTAAGFLVLGLSNSLWLIFLSRIIDGISAGNVSLLYTIVTDLHSPQERSRYFGLIATFTGLGILAGPWLGSVLGTQSLALPSFVAMGLAGLVFCLTWIFLPETRRVNEKGEGQANTQANRGYNLGQILTLLKDKAIRHLLVIILVNNTIFNAFLLTIPIFVANGLNLGIKDIGGIITLLFVFAAVFQLVALQPLLTTLKDYRSAWVGFGLYLIGFPTLLLVQNLTGFLAAGAIIIWGLVILSPVLSAILSNRAGQSEEAILLGINQAVASVGQIIGPILGYTALFFFTNPGLGLSCLILAILGLVLLSNRKLFA